MLRIFRRYEKGIYIVITAVTILSFAFFGTSGTLGTPTVRDEPVFEAIDGTVVKQLELDRMTRFLSSDLFESILSGSPLGANFLNDGVIRKDFIESGVGPLMIRHLGSDNVAFAKERSYRPYQHPETPMISVEGIWSQFAPRLKQAFEAYKKGEFKSQEEAFQAKSHLYLLESTFPHPMLRQVLAFQLGQHKWLKPDPALSHTDLSLFGYHTTRDWFGEGFVKQCAEVVLNVSKKAEQLGYRVSFEAAEADIQRNGELAFHSHRRPEVVKSVPDYIRQELRLLGLDMSEAVSLWRSILLFRSYLKDHTSALVNDGTLFRPFFEGQHEELVIETHTLNPALALSSFEDLQQMECYLESISAGESYPFPQETKPYALVAVETPELVTKQYRVAVKEASLKQIGAVIPLKEVWAFEESSAGKEALQKAFPAIALKGALDSETQKRVDQKARLLMVESNPLRIEEVLFETPSKEMTLTLFKKGGKSPLKGVETAALLESLEGAASTFTLKGDQLVYQITLLDRPLEWNLASFAEAKEAGQLATLVNRRLTSLYEGIKGTLFTNEDGSFKPFSEVKLELAEASFRTLLHDLKRVAPQIQSPDLLASYRFAAYLQGGNFVEGEFAPLVKQEKVLKGQEGPLPYLDLLRLPKGEASQVSVKAGLPLFVVVQGQGTRDFSQIFSTSLAKASHQLEGAVLQSLFDELLTEIGSKGAYTRSDV